MHPVSQLPFPLIDQRRVKLRGDLRHRLLSLQRLQRHFRLESRSMIPAGLAHRRLILSRVFEIRSRAKPSVQFLGTSSLPSDNLFVRPPGPPLRSLIAAAPSSGFFQSSQILELEEDSNSMPFIPMVERRAERSARSIPQPPEAVARRARIEGVGRSAHHRPRNKVLPLGWAGILLCGGHGSRRGRSTRRNMASGKGRRPDVPNAVIAWASRNEGGGIVEPHPGRDRLAQTNRAGSPERSGAQRAGSQRNSVLSRHMRCRTTANFRATATLALRAPIRWVRACPQVFSQEGLVIRLSRTLAASNR